MRKKGFTLIELLAVIVILAVIALIATPIILGIISDSKKQSFKDTAYGISAAAKNDYIQTLYKNQTPVDVTFTYTNGAETSSVGGKVLNYEGAKPKSGVVSLTSTGNVAIAVYDGTYCAYKSFSDIEITIEAKAQADCNYYYSVSKGANAPVLATGMTPIKWDGSKWVETTVGDKDWYSYDTTNKQWANVKTVDGSMWVWIPRYIYKVATNWHATATGTIDIQFSKGIIDNWNGSITLNTGTIANASNNTWTNHPAFWWDNDSDSVRDTGEELTGIWVAKFEPTAVEGVANGFVADGTCGNGNDNVTTKTIKIIPNATSWRCITVGNIFTNVRNMENKSIYGWPTASNLQANGNFSTDTNNLNTHLMKNIEWGVVAYLSKSNYGQGANEIWINPADNFTTGCAGDSTSSVATTGCLRSYETTNGKKASTTGNIYGIYDMSGGSWEYVAAYVNNGNAFLNQGSSIISASNKYKDVYTASPDTDVANYAATANKKGEAIYETSGNIGGANGWFGDYSLMANGNSPWFNRGSRAHNGTSAGAFTFVGAAGTTTSHNSFRPVLVVGSGF